MTHIAICSLVRNGINYLPSFRRQLESLVFDDDTTWHLYCIEGDSTDSSWQFLNSWAQEDERVTLGQVHVGAAGNKEELAKNWAKVGNSCFDLIPEHSNHSHVLWLESDLCFPPETVRRLLTHSVDIVAPVIFLGGLFYDTWGFRGKDGQKWANNPPYHKDFQAFSLIPVNSVGSCVLFSRKVLNAGIRLRGSYENGLLVGMCNDAREQGMRVWADTGTAILHPVDNWERQLWRVTEVSISANGIEQSIAPSDFSAKGINSRLPVLDSETVLKANSSFISSVFAICQSNHIRCDVKASQRSGRHYRMKFTAGQPTGVWAVPLLRNRARMLSSLVSKIRRSWQPTRSSESDENSTLACICHITIEVED